MIKNMADINTKTGVYIEFEVSSESTRQIINYCKENNIETNDDFHCTIIYSNKPFKGKMDVSVSDPIIGKPKKLVRFDNPKDNIYALAIELDCPKCTNTHNCLMKKNHFKYDYPKYIAHVTLSYKAKNIKLKDLPLPKFNIKFNKINIEPLNENWADSKK